MESDSATDGLGSCFTTPKTLALNSKGRSKVNTVDGKSNGGMVSSTTCHDGSQQKRQKLQSEALAHRNPFAIGILDDLDYSKFGSVAKEIQDLVAHRTKLLNQCSPVDFPISCKRLDLEQSSSKDNLESSRIITSQVIILDDDNDVNGISKKQSLSPTQKFLSGPLIILDSSDDEDCISRNSTGDCSFQDFKEDDFAQRQRLDCEAEEPVSEAEIKSGVAYDGRDERRVSAVEITEGLSVSRQDGEIAGECYDEGIAIEDDTVIEEFCDEDVHADTENELRTEYNSIEGEYADAEYESGPEEGHGQADADYDGLTDIWMEMGVAIECSKAASSLPSNDPPFDNKEECDHLLILKDDIGYVCRICGFIEKSIESIIEIQYKKDTRSRRTYRYEGRSCSPEPSKMPFDEIKSSPHDFSANDIYPHPRHQKKMKQHQVEGFNFLISNLMTATPGGCILAHAPGSGKTFLIISFLQSFMAKYPSARPLVVLPRGIVATWKHEFQRWQVESIPLYDFYSLKAESRSQQLEVLQQWVKTRSILFLGYKQLSSIICEHDSGTVSAACQEILLTCPSILVLDEGHTPRNRDTDILTSLQKVQTARKVVLSGTLFQNHVEEVFNILNLVRPKFLKLNSSKAIKRRIFSRVPPSNRKNLSKKCSDRDFYELVEHMFLEDEKDENFKRKVSVIQNLREMTSGILHYYKGDHLDELPGLVDFTVYLKLSPRQEKEVVGLKKQGSAFKISSEGSAFYVHPQLKNCTKKFAVKDRVDDQKIDHILETLDVRDGVKAKFFINLLQLCESKGEKLLVFSQYLLPLKFLERLTIRVKGYSVGKEIFMIKGDSDPDLRESSMGQFNSSANARVFFGSIKACGEGISLVGASRIVILDVHLNPSVTRQAIARAFRPGQQKKVYAYRLIACGSPEEEYHKTCFRKESISKLWFEWSALHGNKDFEMETVDVENCDDMFLESPMLNEDVHSVYKR